MKIFQISTRAPYPPLNGGEIVAYNTIKYLSMRGHDIILISITDKKKKIPEMEKYCRWIPIQKHTGSTIIGLLSNLFSKKPYTISKYHSNEAKRIILEILKKVNVDLVHLDGLHVAYYGAFIKQKLGLPIILREHNVETKIMERFYKNQHNPFIKLYAYFQYKKLYNYEAKISEIFDRCFMITKKDEKLIKQMNPKAKTAVITSGVDTSYFSPIEIEEEPYSIISVGSMDWMPNVESILWFHNKILPQVKEKIPQAKLYVIGKAPPNCIRKLKNEDIIVTGFVEDVRNYIAKCQVFIVPLRTGSGMRIKILVALAMRKAIISTSVGCEGIEVTDGKNIHIADTPEDFAQKIVKLLNNKEERRNIGKEGLKLVKDKYQWERIAEQIEGEYKKILEA